MATVLYTGAAQTIPQVDTTTVGSAVVGTVFSFVVNGKTVSYTAVTGDTTATIAAALNALAGQSNEGEIAELTWANPSGANTTITTTGPSNGLGFTLTTAGNGTLTHVANTTAPVSPSDAGNVKNYSTGALPSAGDTLVFTASSVPVLSNLAALSGIALASLYRRADYGGRLGLPAFNPNGYPEYRTSEFSVNAASITIEQGFQDGAGTFRLLIAGNTSSFTTIGGQAGQQLGSEVVQVRGNLANASVNVSGASLSIAPYANQTANVATQTIRAINGTLNVGTGVTLASLTLMNTLASIASNYTTLNVNGSSQVVVVGNAAGAANSTTIDGGSVTWQSTGTPGNNTLIGSGGAIDFSTAPASVTLGNVTMNAGASLNDPASRITTPWNLQLNRCDLSEVALNVGTGHTLGVS